MPKKRLTIGYRARLRDGNSFSLMDYGGHEVLIAERAYDGLGKGFSEFSVLVLREGKNVPLKKHGDTVINEIWIPESDLEFVDDDLAKNFNFIDWYGQQEYSAYL